MHPSVDRRAAALDSHRRRSDAPPRALHQVLLEPAPRPYDEHVEFDWEEDTRAQLQRVWPRIVAMHSRRAVQWRCDPGSRQAADDRALHPEGSSHVIRLSLLIGVDCLGHAVQCMVDRGPALFAYAPQIRTALVGGAQGVWLQTPAEQGTRLVRAERMARTSWGYRLKWLEDWAQASEDAGDREELQKDLAHTRERTKALKGAKHLGMESMIDEAVEYAMRDPSSRVDFPPDAAIRAKAVYRTTSSVAHALPWEMTARPYQDVLSVGDGVRTTATHASLAEQADGVRISLQLLEAGFRLLDRHSTAL
jgi:hypothetical protein